MRWGVQLSIGEPCSGVRLALVLWPQIQCTFVSFERLMQLCLHYQHFLHLAILYRQLVLPGGSRFLWFFHFLWHYFLQLFYICIYLYCRKSGSGNVFWYVANRVHLLCCLCTIRRQVLLGEMKEVLFCEISIFLVRQHCRVHVKFLILFSTVVRNDLTSCSGSFPKNLSNARSGNETVLSAILLVSLYVPHWSHQFVKVPVGLGKLLFSDSHSVVSWSWFATMPS